MAIVCGLCNEYICISRFFTTQVAFVCKPQDLLNIAFSQLEKFANTHKNNLQVLKEKAKFIPGILLDYKTQQIQDRVPNASMYQKVDTFLKVIWCTCLPYTHHYSRQEQLNVNHQLLI